LPRIVRTGLTRPRRDLPRRRQSAYKRCEINQFQGTSMDALYMIIAFVVVIAILNVVSTGRVD